MFQNINKYLIHLILLLAIFMSNADGREYCDEALVFIDEVTDETLSIINSSEFTKKSKKSNLSELLINKNADFETMGKIMLGKYVTEVT